MRNRLGVTLALTAILSLGGMTFAKTVRTIRPQNANTAGTMGGNSHKSRKHHRRHHRRHHRKMAAAHAHR